MTSDSLFMDIPTWKWRTTASRTLCFLADSGVGYNFQYLARLLTEMVSPIGLWEGMLLQGLSALQQDQVYVRG